MRLIYGALQIGALYLLSYLGGIAAHALDLPIPGSIIGMILLFALLHLKAIKLSWVETGAGFLLSELLLFFIPSAVGVVKYRSRLITQGPYLLAVIVIGTLIVMAATGLLAEFIINRRNGVRKSEHSL